MRLKERKIEKENGIPFSNKTYITIEFFYDSYKFI